MQLNYALSAGLLTAGLCLICGSLAHAQQSSLDISPAPPKDEMCLVVARFGEQVALARSEGMSEAKTLEKVGLGKKNKKVEAEPLRNVVSYVYTVELQPVGARKVIFEKCKAGDIWHVR